MATVVIAPAASEDLDRLTERLHLPADTRRRVAARLGDLEHFPLLGPALTGRWWGFRFLLGPWSWMLIVYRYDDQLDQVDVVTLQDSRTAAAATSSR